MLSFYPFFDYALLRYGVAVMDGGAVEVRVADDCNVDVISGVSVTSLVAGGDSVALVICVLVTVGAGVGVFVAAGRRVGARVGAAVGLLTRRVDAGACVLVGSGAGVSLSSAVAVSTGETVQVGCEVGEGASVADESADENNG
jgi:hypothetical protein